MAMGRRCDTGCASWPDDPRYRQCPICGEFTTRYSNLQPLDDDEATQREFEAYYESYCARRSQPVSGPLPMSPEQSLLWDGKYPEGRPSDDES
jgi:hypothetical protein